MKLRPIKEIATQWETLNNELLHNTKLNDNQTRELKFIVETLAWTLNLRESL